MLFTKEEKETLDSIRQMMGLIENGTQQTIKLSHDDITNEYVVTVNAKYSYGELARVYKASSFIEALELAKIGELSNASES